jgi:DNA-binding transcriptional LysR family regulator
MRGGSFCAMPRRFSPSSPRPSESSTRIAKPGGRASAAFAAAWKTLVPQAVRLLRDGDPRVEVALENAEPEASIPALCRADLDLAVVYEPNEAPPPTEDLHRDPLADHRLCVVLPRTHPLAARAHLSLADLADAAWVDAGDHLLHAACSAAGFVPKVVFESRDYTAV